MKVVLFCGGAGMRLRDYSDTIPKPMVNVGYRPILWHVMKYYAHYGYKDFILCLGYRGDVIKNYFLNYSECLTNDFVLSNGGKELRLLHADIDDWRITFVDTGQDSNIGQRLKAVENHLEGEEMFFANYTDGLTDMPLPVYLDYFVKRKKTGSFVCVRPNQSFHVVSLMGDLVKKVEYASRSDIWMNGGFFIFRREIFGCIQNGEELVEEPFQRLIKSQELIAYKYSGFWTAMDTFKDKQRLDDIAANGSVPWEVWKQGQSSHSKANHA